MGAILAPTYFMEKLYALARNVQKLNDIFIAVESFTRKDVQDLIIELNTQGQLFDKGEDSLGNLLPRYSKVTELITRGKKKEGQPFTLKNTGEFYGSFFVTVNSQGDFDINADTLKADVDQIVDLRDIASPYIIGLSDESKEKLSRFLVEIIREITRRTLSGI